jgi:hypothetical protein
VKWTNKPKAQGIAVISVVLPPVAGESLVCPLEHEPQDVDDAAAAASFPSLVGAGGGRCWGNANVFGRPQGSRRIGMDRLGAQLLELECAAAAGVGQRKGRRAQNKRGEQDDGSGHCDG